MKFKILISFLIISVFCNIYGICFILGKGITINNSYHQEQYQQQWQGQLLINQWTSQGDQIEWKEVILNKENTLSIQLNKLHPVSALYSKLIPVSMDVYVLVYPDIFTKTKEVQK